MSNSIDLVKKRTRKSKIISQKRAVFAKDLVPLQRGVLSLWQRYAEKCATQKIVKDANRTTNIIPEGYPEDEFEKTE